jgi:hypothetical protein
MRDTPDAEKRLRKGITDCLARIEAIDLVYGVEPNEWAAASRPCGTYTTPNLRPQR